jgi:acarbose 7IV-phosphotransferase
VTFDVVVLGGCGVDTIVRVDELAVPADAGDGIVVPPIRDYAAHSGNGVALGCHALGLRTVFADFLGDDPQGRVILDRYARAGLDFRYLPAPNGTPRSVNLVDREGRRFSFFDGRHPADLRLPSELVLPLLEQAGHAHLSNGATTIDVFAETARLGSTTSTDIHAWDGRTPAPHAQYADVVFLSAAALQDACADAMRTLIGNGRAKLVVATDGSRGCRVLSRAEMRVRQYPAIRPERPVLDSNGAGDAFSTAFLSRWLAGADLDECALAGAVSGAFACGSAGTHEEFIGPAELAAACAKARAAWPAG